MRYILITPSGTVFTFYLLATAQCWAQAYGGTLIDDTVALDFNSVLA